MKDNGGHAFPTQIIEIDDFTGQGRHEGMEAISHCKHPGMTLRQWYAGMALQGWAAGRNNGSDFHSESKPDRVAESCFKYADAMITQESK